MRRNLLTLVALLATIALLILARAQKTSRAPEPVREPEREVVTAVPLEADHKVGAGSTFDDLTVFPILAEEQPDLGPFVTLEQALQDRTAEVREKSGGGSVSSLVIQNKGPTSIFVLAGTVVKGGKQDRQIAQDFAVGPMATVPVEAFCVEQRRWNASRQGVATDGKFGTLKTLAHSRVRAAGQYKKNQGEVWAQVGEVNAASRKATETGTLTATLDDKEIGAARSALARRIAAFADGLSPQRDVVGIAYAVEGRVRGVRWFANHDLYAMYREVLFNTAAVEAVTAQRAAAAATAGGPPKARVPPPTAEAVRTFVSEIDAAPVAEERPTSGENVNAYKETKRGYGSSAAFKSPPGTPATASFGEAKARKKARTISSDFVAKP